MANTGLGIPTRTGNAVLDKNLERIFNLLSFILKPGGELVPNSHVIPGADNSYYVGETSSPFRAWKGIVLKDTTDGRHYKFESVAGVLTATALD